MRFAAALAALWAGLAGMVCKAQEAPPPKLILVEYARQAFSAADRAFGAIDDQLLQERGTDIYGRVSSVGYVLLVHLSHASRHLGTIEGLRGVQGLRGTATV